MPTNTALHEHYRNYRYYNSPLHEDGGEEVTFDDSQRFGRHLAEMIVRYPSDPPSSILDFGGGDGSLAWSLALHLLKRGMERIRIIVVDYHDKIHRPYDSRISIRQAAVLEDVDFPQSIVMASAIIEHLPRPRETLRHLLNCLEGGGFFYARTPYVVPLIQVCRRFGISWDFGYPGHLHDLGQDFWETYFGTLIAGGEFQLLESRPSIVETTLKQHFLRTVAAYAAKAPWHIVGRRYPWVGGWEILVRKHGGHDARLPS